MAKFNLAEALRLDVSNLDSDAAMQRIELALIDPNPANFFHVEADITDLAESIAVNGLLQPLVVAPAENGRYRVIAGHRRRMALLALAEAEPEKWKYVDCKVIAPASPELEMLALIQTNTAAREISYLERNTAVDRVEQILVKLQQEQGIKLPGKMRANVAKIIRASESQIARAKFIAAHLVEEAHGADLTDDAAYKLAHLPPEQQRELYAHYRGTSLRYSLTPAAIKQYTANIVEGRKPFSVPIAVNKCYHRKSKNNIYPDCDYCDQIKKNRKASGMPFRCPSHCTCCNSCGYRVECSACCKHLCHDIEKAKQCAEYALGQRIKAAREACGLSREEASKRLKLGSAEELARYENGGYQIAVPRILDFCRLYNADPTVILDFIPKGRNSPAPPQWARSLFLDYTPSEGELLLVVYVPNSDIPSFVDCRAARWHDGRLVSAVNQSVPLEGALVGFIPLPELPDGFTFDVEAFT